VLLAKLKAKHDAMAATKLPPEEVAKLIKAGAFVVDVRPKIQAKMGMVPGATNISIFTLKRRLDELPRDRKIVLHCHSGASAAKAKEMLDALGFKAFNGGGYKDVLKVVRAIASSKAAAAGSGR
jgi:rhodanese-related sulfurtransferase